MKYPRIHPLAIGIIVPLIIALTVGIGLSLPRLLIKPEHDFIYSYSSSNDAEYYSVRDGVLVTVQNAYPSTYSTPHHTVLYLYDVKSDTSKEVTVSEANSYGVSSKYDSFDGYRVSTGNTSDFSLRSSYYSDYYAVFLRNHWGKKKLNIKSQENISYANFNFIGWTTK